MNEQDMQSLFVDRDYVMNPEDDDLLFDGTELRPGMIVLVESSLMKADIDGFDNKYDRKRILECNRWCEVVRVEIEPRFQEDEAGRTIPSSPLVKFLARYPDGTLANRTYDASYAWYVKKFSIPQES